MRLKNFLRYLRGHFFSYNINVKNNTETVKLILKYKSSVVRLGDGELDLINGKDIPYQKFDKKLADKLKYILYKRSDTKEVICLPDIFTNRKRYDFATNEWYFENFFYQNRKLLKQVATCNHWYGSTFISRPYLALKNKNNVKEYYQSLKKIWDNLDLLIVEGKYTRSGEGNDLFSNANSIQRIICPAKDAYDYKDKIEKSINIHGKDKLVLIMLGPTAKAIADDLSDKMQIIDLGHVDSEYEWYKLSAQHRVKIPGKHTAEFNNDDDKVKLKNDPKFDKEIIEVIE